MRTPSLPRWKHVLGAPMLSPSGFLVRAAILVLFFMVCHWLGWREHTTFLSGTSAGAGTSINTSATLGVIYIAAYFGAVLAAPILVLGAAFLAVLQGMGTRKNSESHEPVTVSHP